MANYNPKSLKAEEFINDGEILDTLAYAEANKNNMELINEILEKARPQKTETGYVCKGLTHREASVLLACENEEITNEMYSLAQQIKKDFYGNGFTISNFTVKKSGGALMPSISLFQTLNAGAEIRDVSFENVSE